MNISLSALHGKDTLPCRRDHLIHGKIPADHLFHPETLQSGCRKECPVISLCFKFPHPCLHISPDSPECTSRIQPFHLKHPSPAGSADDRLFRQRFKAGAVQDRIPRIFPFPICKDRELRVFFHRHVFQTVHGNIDPAIHERTVQFLYKQTFSPDLFQALIQYFISCCFHRNNFHRNVRIAAYNLVPDDLRLFHCKPALPAADLYYRLHDASFPFSMI